MVLNKKKSVIFFFLSLFSAPAQKEQCHKYAAKGGKKTDDDEYEGVHTSNMRGIKNYESRIKDVKVDFSDFAPILS
ncbi:MAG: hypothetical protein HYY92_00895 [Parcubacteria group bacterium]|nr:hypothetical protein [Parcubacteria group bacterium]